jgi:hypothetical protein
VCAQRGRLGESDKPTGLGQFQWTQAVKALAILMLRCAAWSMRVEQNGHSQPPQLSGRHKTPASSLNWAISLGNDWLGGMFGTDEAGQSYVRQMISRENADFTRSSPGNLRQPRRS